MHWAPLLSCGLLKKQPWFIEQTTSCLTDKQISHSLLLQSLVCFPDALALCLGFLLSVCRWAASQTVVYLGCLVQTEHQAIVKTSYSFVSQQQTVVSHHCFVSAKWAPVSLLDWVQIQTKKEISLINPGLALGSDLVGMYHIA